MLRRPGRSATLTIDDASPCGLNDRSCSSSILVIAPMVACSSAATRFCADAADETGISDAAIRSRRRRVMAVQVTFMGGSSPMLSPCGAPGEPQRGSRRPNKSCDGERLDSSVVRDCCWRWNRWRVRRIAADGAIIERGIHTGSGRDHHHCRRRGSNPFRSRRRRLTLPGRCGLRSGRRRAGAHRGGGTLDGTPIRTAYRQHGTRHARRADHCPGAVVAVPVQLTDNRAR